MAKTKKRMLPLAILAFVLILLVGGYVILDRLDLNGTEETPAAEATPILNVPTADVTQVSYHASAGTEMSFTKDGEKWYWDGDKKMPLNQALFTTMLSEITLITPTSTVKEPQALSVYGLQEPAYTYTLQYQSDNGTETKILWIGDLNTYNSCHYLKFADSDSLYLFEDEISTYFDKSLNDWLDMEVLPQLDEKTMQSCSYQGITVKDSETLSKLYTLYSGLLNTNYYSYYSDEATLATAGFTAESPQVAFTYTEEAAVVNDDESVSTTTVTKTYTVKLTLGGEVRDQNGGTVRAYRLTNTSGDDLKFIYYMDAATYDTLMQYFA